MDLTIKKMGINGEGIGYDNKIPIFVMGALPQETVECKVVENHTRYKVAELIRIKKKSSARIQAVCPYQKECGGCPLMTLNYEGQLQVKRELLIEALKKYADGYKAFVEEIIPSPEVMHYRNQCKLPTKMIKNKLCSGMYVAGTNHLVGLDECPVHEKQLDEARVAMTQIFSNAGYRDYDDKARKGIRHFVVRIMGNKIQATVVTGNDIISKAVIEQVMDLPNMASLFQNVNTSRKSVPLFGERWVHLAGNKSLVIEENGLKLKLSPASFFQLNTKQAFELYQQVANVIPECDLLVEAYCGIGTMSLLMAERAKEVIGIEIVNSAIKNANENARLNHIEHAKFIVGDAAEETTKISKRRKIDVLLLDPPRSGIDEAMMDCIMRSKIKTIVYVSCNPATLAKNLKELGYRYQVQRIIPLDMFPNTPHVESVVLLTKV